MSRFSTAGFVACLLLTLHSLHAGEMTLDHLHAELTALRDRIGTLEEKPASAGPSVFQPKHETGVIGGFELTLLEPHYNGGAGGGAGAGNANFDPELGWRMWIGYMLTEGWSVRTRYWQWDHQAGPQIGITGATVATSIFAQTMDLEFSHEFPFRKWLLNLGAGARYGAFDVDSYSSAAGPSFDDARFDGSGTTMFLEGRKPLSDQLSLISKVRYSMLLGTIKDHQDAAGPGLGRLHDSFLDIAEFQLGAEWFQENCCGMRIFVRLVFEVQRWQTDELDALGTDTTFAGPSLSIGLSR